MATKLCVKTLPADRFTPLVVFKKLGGKALLESAVLEIGKSRYSLILAQEAFRLVLTDKGVYKIEESKSNRLTSDRSAYLDCLKKEGFKARCLKDYDFPIPACGVGYLGYETAELFDTIRLAKQKDDLGIPDGVFLFGSLFVVFDHYKDELHVIAIDRDGSGKRRLNEAIERLMDVDLDAYRTDDKVSVSSGDLAFGKEDFIKGVESLRKDIVSGNIVQAVLSRCVKVKSDLTPLEAYGRLRRINPSPYLFYFDFGEFHLLGSSPELMVSLSGNTATIKPIAGTRPRGKTRHQDIAFEKDLLSDEKERAEHLMLVDLARNDLGRTADSGTVSPRALFTIERYSHVMHIVSEIESEMARGKDVYDLIRTTFPAGTVSGAPKIKAMELVSQLEKTKRGPYAGLVGHFDIDGNFDSCIIIRSFVYKQKAFYVQAGAGIVYDSVPEKEYYETRQKAQALIASLGIKTERGRS